MITTENLDALLPIGSLIGDRWVSDQATGQHLHHDPTTGRVQREVPLAGASEVDAAVAAARAALPKWKRRDVVSRAEVLNAIAALLRERRELFSDVAALENGTPALIGQYLAAVRPAEWFNYYASWLDKLEGTTIPLPGGDFNYTRHEPYGVVAIVIPWNAPVTMIGMKVAPALAAGNTVVLKPPELAPFTSLHFARLCLDAGLPAGVVNVVVGGPEAGDALCRHPGVDKISFTGGRPTARKVMEAAAAHTTPVALELGGKSANVVFEDAPVEEAVGGAVMTVLSVMAGQACAVPSRILVHESVYDRAGAAAVSTAEMLRVGVPSDPSTVVGPLISAASCERVAGMIDRATAAGATLLTGGSRVQGELADGYFFSPTILGDVDNAAEIAQQEVFGPVVTITPFADVDQAIALANGTEYGLAGYVWTRDVSRAHHVAANLEAGVVSINAARPPSSANIPFGGMRRSGFGREGGKEGLLEFLQTKNVYLAG